MMFRLFNLLIARLFSPLSSFLLIVLITRIWGTESLGQYSTVLVWFAIFQFISLFGAGEYISKEIGRDPSTASRYLIHGLFFGMIASVVCIFFMGGGALLFNYTAEVKYSILVMSASLPFVSSTMICQSVFTAFQKIKYITLASVLESALIMLSGLFVIYRHLGLIVLVACLVFIRILSTVLNLYMVNKYFVRLNFQFQLDRNFLGKLISSIAVFGVTGVAFQIFMRADIIILSTLMSMADVGLYSSASKLWEICLMLPLTFYVLNLPVVAQGYQRSRGVVQQEVESYAKNLFVPVFLLFGFVFFFAESVLRFIYGPSFTSSLWLLRIFMLAYLIQSADMILGMICQASGHHKAAMHIAVLRAGVNVVLNIVLIPFMGLLGAALATLFAISLSFIAFQIFVKRTLHQLRWFSVAAKPALICMLTMLLLFPLRNHVNTIGLWFIFVIGYIIMIFPSASLRLKINTSHPE